MILNSVDIGISKIELNKSDLLIVDESGHYCLKVCVEYNWKDINNLVVGDKKNIDFNEYCISENNESALIWPCNCVVEKLSDGVLYFYLKFKDLSNEQNTCYMNKRGCFDIELKSLEVKILIDYKDANDGSIVYNF